jgi:excisionase family DNA binding protein
MSKRFEALAKLMQSMIDEAVDAKLKQIEGEKALKTGDIVSLGFLTAPEACRQLGIDRTTMWRWIKTGQIPGDQVRKLGKMTWIHQDFLKKQAG